MASHGVPRFSAVEPSEQSQKRELKKIEAYKTLVGQLQDKINSHQYTAETLIATSNLLTQNPEYYTIWNFRRLILRDVFAKELSAPQPPNPDNGLGPTVNVEVPVLSAAQQEISLLIKEDLAFLIPLLRNFPKCYWIWNHRAWLLQQASEHLPVASAKRLWQEEMALVGKMLSYDSRNFHGWGYRRIIVEALENQNLNEEKLLVHEKESGRTSSGSSMAEGEFAYTTKMIKANLSNFSAWHTRSQLIPRLLTERKADSTARRQLLDEEFDLITQALYTDPYDQSLWFYHQYLMTTLSPKAPESIVFVQDLTNQDRLEYFDQQIDSIKDMLELTDDCKWIYQALLNYAAQYMDIEAGNKKITTLEMRSWLEELEKLDPLRTGRWQDLRKDLDL